MRGEEGVMEKEIAQWQEWLGLQCSSQSFKGEGKGEASLQGFNFL